MAALVLEKHLVKQRVNTVRFPTEHEGLFAS
jgi:hypothetical protein